jgi:hypothetical protein
MLKDIKSSSTCQWHSQDFKMGGETKLKILKIKNYQFIFILNKGVFILLIKFKFINFI